MKQKCLDISAKNNPGQRLIRQLELREDKAPTVVPLTYFFYLLQVIIVFYQGPEV
jgi:hypothetical protein